MYNYAAGMVHSPWTLQLLPSRRTMPAGTRCSGLRLYSSRESFSYSGQFDERNNMSPLVDAVNVRQTACDW